MSLIEQLKRQEGFSARPYRDTVGKLTIGWGRNLDDVGVSSVEAEFLLRNDIFAVDTELARRLPWTNALDESRRNVLVNMAFNMGFNGLLGFVNTLLAVEEERYDDAAKGMLASKWAKQVGNRAVELAEQMRTGIEK